MRRILIALNLILALATIYVIGCWFSASGDNGKSASVSAVRRTATSKNDKKEAELVEVTPEISIYDAGDTVVQNDIFDPARSPIAANPGRSNYTMQLVGVMDVEGVKYAVITRKTREVRPWNPYHAIMSQLGNLQTSQQRQNAQQQQQQQQSGQPRNVNQFGNARQELRSAPKQYFKLGDVLENGYTLSEIESDRVLLTRGNGKLELYLESASVNQPQMVQRQMRVSTTQQLADVQTAQMQSQQMMMVMMMQLMRMNQNQQAPQGSAVGGTAIGGSVRATPGTASSGRR